MFIWTYVSFEKHLDYIVKWWCFAVNVDYWLFTVTECWMFMDWNVGCLLLQNVDSESRMFVDWNVDCLLLQNVDYTWNETLIAHCYGMLTDYCYGMLIVLLISNAVSLLKWNGECMTGINCWLITNTDCLIVECTC